MIVGFGRRCYRREVKPFKNSEETVTFQWYPAPEGAKMLPFMHPYEQLGWTPRPWEHTGLGEVYEAFCHYGKCKIPPCVTGQGPPLGDKDLWMNGTTYDLAKPKTKRDKNGIPFKVGGGCEPIWVEGGAESAEALPAAPLCCTGHVLSDTMRLHVEDLTHLCWHGTSYDLIWNGSQWRGTYEIGTCGNTFTFELYCEDLGEGAHHWALHLEAEDGCVDAVINPGPVICEPLVELFFQTTGTLLADCGLDPVGFGNLIVIEIPPPPEIATLGVMVGIGAASHFVSKVIGRDTVTLGVSARTDATSHFRSSAMGHDTATLGVRGAIEVASSLFQPSSVVGHDTAMLGVRGGIEVVSYVYGSIVGSDIVTLGVSTTLDVTSHVES